MNIGQVARISGISNRMIRHYESIGLIKSTARSASGYRIYNDEDLQVLKFIKQSRNHGFTLEQIGQLLSLWQNRERASADVKALATQHISELNEKIDELTRMRDALAKLARSCAGDKRSACTILDTLAGVR